MITIIVSIIQIFICGIITGYEWRDSSERRKHKNDMY